MYNANKPSPDDLPSAVTLLRSTVLAVLGAGVILVTIVLPAEYGIDPIGIGRFLGLTEAGQIKAQLTAGAEPETRTDEIIIELAPGEGTEVKLVMNAGSQADYDWIANGILEFDRHGDGVGRSISYEKGQRVAKIDGVIKAAFDGNHGWYWQNRTDAIVKLTLRTTGAYHEFERKL